MSLPLTTRFGADPLIDEELANKRYVDAQAGGGAFAWIGHVQAQNIGSSTTFGSCFGGDVVSTTENFRKNPAPINFTWSNLKAQSLTNGSTTDTVINTRINSADGNMTVTIPDATTGIFTDAVNTDTVSEDDEINFEYNRGASAGTLQINGVATIVTP